MTKEDAQTKNFEQPRPEQLADVFSALNMLAVAVAALPNTELLIGDPTTGPAAFLKVTPEKGLTVRYKSGENQVSSDSSSTVVIGMATETTVPTNPVTTSKQETEKQRATLHGRLGADPRFNTTKKGVLVARFPLAVPDAEQKDRVSWQTIVAFNKTAKKLQDATVAKGQRVEVIGYWHEKVSKPGKPSAAKELYAAVVKPINKPIQK